jgi:hypothetical protein
MLYSLRLYHIISSSSSSSFHDNNTKRIKIIEDGLAADYDGDRIMRMIPMWLALVIEAKEESHTCTNTTGNISSSSNIVIIVIIIIII